MELRVDAELKNAAIIAGLSLLLMAILAPFANFYVLKNLIVPGDAFKTANNIIASEGLFRIGICSFMMVAVLDMVVAWAFYVLLKPVNKSLSLLAGWFRLAYAAVLGAALVNLLNVLQLVHNTGFLKGTEASQIQVQVILSIQGFYNGWDIGLVFFGFHLLVIGYLVFKSGYFPRLLGVFLIVAALGYLTDSFGKFLWLGYNMTVAMYTFIGEVLLIFWLFWRGVKGFDSWGTNAPTVGLCE